MYGLEKSLNLQFLIGRELLQLCIGLCQVIMRFSEDTSISIECDLRFTGKNGEIIYLLDIPESSKYLFCLLGMEIVDVMKKDAGDLTLVFSNGFELTLIDSNESTESYTITTPEQEVVV